MLGRPAPAYSDGLVVAGFASGELAAVRSDTGTVVWTDNLASGQQRSNAGDIASVRGLPVIADGRVHAIGLGGLLVALDLRSGRRLWDRQVAGENSLWVAGNWLFLISADQQIAAVQTQDGAVAWVTDLPKWVDEKEQDEPVYWAGPILADSRLLTVGTNGEAILVDPVGGKILKHQKIAGPASVAPIAAGGTVYVLTDSGELLALR